LGGEVLMRLKHNRRKIKNGVLPSMKEVRIPIRRLGREWGAMKPDNHVVKGGRGVGL